VTLYEHLNKGCSIDR